MTWGTWILTGLVLPLRAAWVLLSGVVVAIVCLALRNRDGIAFLKFAAFSVLLSVALWWGGRPFAKGAQSR